MYRYRMINGASRHVIARFNKHREKLGDIVKVEARRFLSWRGKPGEKYFTDHEVLMLFGTKGTARFTGCCWGYTGEGPRTVYELLRSLGLTQEKAAHFAYTMPRSCGSVSKTELAKKKNKTIVDWTVNL